MTPLQEDLKHASPEAITNNREVLDSAIAAPGLNPDGSVIGDSGYHYEYRDGAVVRVRHDLITQANLE